MRRFGALLLLVSGATALSSALLWSRYLTLSFGSGGKAYAVTLGALMAGLALGHWLFDRKLARPLMLSGALQTLGGLCALALPFVHAAATLLIPATLMGGSLALLSRQLPAPRSRVFATWALGAVLGALLTGLRLVPVLGLEGAARAVAILSLTAGLIAVVWGRGEPTPEREPETLPTAGALELAAAAFVLVLVALAQARVVTLALGAGADAFMLVLAALFGSFALGCRWLAPRARPVATVVALALVLPVLGRLPQVLGWGLDALERSPETWVVFRAFAFLVCAVVLPVPMLWLAPRFSAAQGRGWLYAAAGALGGAVAGALLAFEVSLIVAVAAAFSSAAFSVRRPLPLLGVAALAIACVLGAVPRPAGAPALFSSDDGFAHVGVDSDRRELRLDGRPAVESAATAVLAGHLGALLSSQTPKRVLVIGASAPATLAAVLSHRIEQLDVVEVSAAVLLAVQVSQPGLLDDPRVKVHRGEAMAFLSRGAAPYDLIISVPADAALAGVARLYTTELYRAAAAQLTEHGVFVQWARTAGNDEASLKLVLRTLRAVFAHGTSWVGSPELVMVLTKQPLALDLDAMAARMSVEAVRENLGRIEVRQVSTLLAQQAHSDRAQREYAGEGLINTQDSNRLEAMAPLAAFLRAPWLPIADQRRQTDVAADLELARMLPLDAASARALHVHFSTLLPSADPLIRTSAQRWLDADPADEEAAVAVARAALAQGEVSTARALLAPWTASALGAQAFEEDVRNRRSVLNDVSK